MTVAFVALIVVSNIVVRRHLRGARPRAARPALLRTEPREADRT